MNLNESNFAASGALHGVRVVDLPQNAPGPFATMVLGDLGADVIQIANPSAMLAGSPYLDVVASDPLFATERRTLMRNKRSIGLNLKRAPDREVLDALIAKADIFVEEMRPGKAQKLGLDFGVLSSRHPRLIYCSITGFGQTGPFRDTASHDLNCQALAGFVSLLTPENAKPVLPLNVLGDYVGGGLMSVVGILAALSARKRTGRGQHVDVSMSDGALYALTDLLGAWLDAREPPQLWRGTLAGDLPVYACYRCRDGKSISVAALEKRFAAAFLEIAGLPDLMVMVEDRSCWVRRAV